MVVTYGTMKRASLVLTVARNPLDPVLAPAPADRANAVSELIPVKPDGIINGCRVTGPACLQFDLFARVYLVAAL